MSIEHALLAPLDLARHPALTRRFEAVKLPAGKPLPAARRAGQPVYFVASGVVAVTGFAADGRALDVASIGRDGFTGSELLLGEADWRCRMAMQAPGAGWRIAAGELTELAHRHDAFRDGLLGFAGALVGEIIQTALGCCHGTRLARVARWIATMQARLGGDTVPTTHDVIATAIGAHRPGVTSALHLLEGERLIRLERGRVQVLDRDGLLAASRRTEGPRGREFAQTRRRASGAS